MTLNQGLSMIFGMLIAGIPFFYVMRRQFKCALCAAPWVKTTWKNENVIWEGVQGTVEIPVRTCRRCGESYTDYAAEKIRDAFVTDTKKKLRGYRITRTNLS